MFKYSFIHVIPSVWLNPVVTIISTNNFSNIVFKYNCNRYEDKFQRYCLYSFIGIFYIVFFMMFVAFINGMPNGNINVWYAIIAAWGTDIHILSENILENINLVKLVQRKSIEGCIVGTIGAVILMLGYTYFANTYWGVSYSYGYIAIIGVILSLIGQIGDFSASSIKKIC